MMGPAPMMRMLCMSVRFGISVFFHQGDEAIKEWSDIVRAGAGFGVALETKRRFVGARQTLQSVVKEADMGRAQVRRQGTFIHCKAMVLAGNGDTTTIQILDRMVGTMVAELHLEGFCARRQGHDLVAQANTKCGDTGFDQLCHR